MYISVSAFELYATTNILIMLRYTAIGNQKWNK